MEPKTFDELRAHYLAVSKRLGGVRGATGVVPPARVFRPVKPNPPVEIEPKKVSPDSFILDVKLPRYRFIEMMRTIAAKHGVDPEAVMAPSRKKVICVAKQEVQYRAKHELGMTLSQIGNIFKNDHTSILYGIRKHEERIKAQANPK